MRQLLPQFLRKRTVSKGPRRKTANVLRPDAPFFAIGDIHARLDLLDQLLSRIDPKEDQRLIFLGDYIDRGPDAAGTLERLFQMSRDRPDQVVCLMGNHERMMLDFIDDPLGRGRIWLRNGGVETLESFGLKGYADITKPDDVMEVCCALEQAIDPDMTAWLRHLPKKWHSGNVWCVHAAMDPARPPDSQRSKTLLWGHPDFLRISREDDVCVVHGHTTVSVPTNENSRIAIDTGAYQTGCLTAAHVTKDSCRFSHSSPSAVSRARLS